MMMMTTMIMTMPKQAKRTLPVTRGMLMRIILSISFLVLISYEFNQAPEPPNYN
jgi:hypothetical protein